MHAQSYSSIKMEELGSAIPALCLPASDSIFSCPGLVKKKSLVVNYNSNREITHLGISMFSNETKELINLPVCNFIERIMLELILEKTNEDLIQKLNRYKLSLLKNGVEFGSISFTSLSNVLDNIQNPAQFSLSKEPDKFAAVWEYNNNDRLVFIFPATRDLIFGTDKKESDELLNKALSESDRLCYEKDKILNETVSEADLSLNKEKNIFTKSGGKFFLPVVNSNTYYIKTGDVLKLVFSKDFPEESFTNLIMKNTGDLSHLIHIKHRMYGNFTPDFKIQLKDFLCYFRDDYNFFTAVASPEQGTLKLTVILQSKAYNFIHLLLISAPVENIFRQDGMFSADFYSNIPQQSIRNLMGEITTK